MRYKETLQLDTSFGGQSKRSVLESWRTVGNHSLFFEYLSKGFKCKTLLSQQLSCVVHALKCNVYSCSWSRIHRIQEESTETLYKPGGSTSPFLRGCALETLSVLQWLSEYLVVVAWICLLRYLNSFTAQRVQNCFSPVCCCFREFSLSTSVYRWKAEVSFTQCQECGVLKVMAVLEGMHIVLFLK